MLTGEGGPGNGKLVEHVDPQSSGRVKPGNLFIFTKREMNLGGSDVLKNTSDLFLGLIVVLHVMIVHLTCFCR